MKNHRVCFTGHRPDKLVGKETDIRKYLNEEIDKAIANGFVTFITGMCAGIDIMAAELVIMKKYDNPDLHLIAASPYPNFGYTWADGWGDRIKYVASKADLIVNVSAQYTDKSVFQKRNIWMVDHSNLLISVWNGTSGGTKNTIDYAKQTGIQIINYDEKKLPAQGTPELKAYIEDIEKNSRIKEHARIKNGLKYVSDDLYGLRYEFNEWSKKESFNITQLHAATIRDTMQKTIETLKILDLYTDLDI